MSKVMSLKVRLELNVEALSTLYVLDTFFLPQEFSSSKNVKKAAFCMGIIARSCVWCKYS